MAHHAPLRTEDVGASTLTEQTTAAAPALKRSMTHNQLVRRMALWVQNNRRYSVVVTELATRVSETPDVIGFNGPASLLVECKISRADFIADRAKNFRACADRGMGDLRYFAAPAGVIEVADLPDGWGLLEIRERQVWEIVTPRPQKANKRNEVAFLVSVLRRLQLSTAVYVREDPPGSPAAE